MVGELPVDTRAWLWSPNTQNGTWNGAKIAVGNEKCSHGLFFNIAQTVDIEEGFTHR